MKPEWTAENIKITLDMMKILRSETSSSRVHTIMQRAINHFEVCLRVEQEEATERAVQESNARAKEPEPDPLPTGEEGSIMDLMIDIKQSADRLLFSIKTGGRADA